MIQTLVDAFANVQGWLFETAVQPLVFALGLAEYVEDAFDGTEWFLIGVCELALLFLVLRPLEAAIPVHAFDDPRARWTDFIYTVLHRLGVFALIVFFLLDPLFAQISEWLHWYDLGTFNLEDVWPGMSDRPLVTFMFYLVALDFFEYWYHRAQHGIRWMWALHSLHHSQQNMNLWSDDRNHILDDLIHDLMIGLLALTIGVQPAQFILLVSVSRMLQSLQHANIRLHFGRLGEPLLVSPRFHRLHHAIGLGHESHGSGSLGGHNFAVLLPIWDIVFRTARFGGGYARTGVRDQLPPPQGKGRDYGSGFWSQQWLGFKRLFGRSAGRETR
ncbi:sterol desaturase family protein [Herbaspirillum sp. RTI4]|uniref:sterol desaturase family protein n=1 Tax=Herbaspirillum sp. RTI4 TaxID=3048640 RepID=UPI002AB352B3|nr:sterol desaturase family protein [Herbaspirillum sp. RTI4]MDY7579706.1 sterol desaturase family protein [Herbaspirillum sp. RTI4]MEA9983033.1 sterol desaturase family protein [Herbaspirillum sp. RTI4]